MKRFDLTFKGDILPDFEPGQVRKGFADLFRINDPLVLDELFSGDAFVLRSNLDRKSAADYFRKISQLGGRAELVPREMPGERSAVTGLTEEVLTRVPESDPAAFVAPGRNPRADKEHPPWPITDIGTVLQTEAEPITMPEPKACPRPTNPSSEEILTRLQRLQQEAEAAHNSKLEQLEQLQAEVKQETSAALEQIKLRRDQVLIETQDEISRLEEMEASSRKQYETDTALLDSEEEEQSRRLHKDIKRLAKKHKNKCTVAKDTAEQLQQDRDDRQEQAAQIITRLEAQIIETRRLCENDLAEIDRLLGKTSSDLEQFELEFGQQKQSLQASHEQTLKSLELKRQEHLQHFETDREEILRLQQKNEIHREEQLTGLWEKEEKSQHDAQARLKQLEVTRKRHENSLQQRLERLQEEAGKIRRGEEITG